MKLPILLLLIITAIQFQLNFIGTEHQPNWVKVYSYEREIPVISKAEKIDGVWMWKVYSENEELISFLSWWQ